MSPEVIVVCGAGGFIGGHLVADLLRQGHRAVRAVDIKAPIDWFQASPAAENVRLDLRVAEACGEAVAGAHTVYNLAADMGGMGFVESNKALCMLSVLIDTHLCLAASRCGVARYFYASSACVYAADRQARADVVPLKESDAYPAMPEDGYGWQKLFGERLCRHFREDLGLQTRVARYHNVCGPHGTYNGGCEKAPAAICRKVIEAKLSGTQAILASEILEPINLGSSELVTIDQLVDMAEEIAGVKLERTQLTRHLPARPSRTPSPTRFGSGPRRRT
jgi:nucleoside-diphosphate-sugar epimerase